MYKLSVNGGLVDFIGEPKIILMASDPLEYAIGKAHKTYYIDIVDTSNNRKLLYDEDIHEAILMIGEIQIKGLLYLDSIEDDTTKGMFVSGVGDVWENLRGVNLSELDFSEYNHILNEDNVVNSEAGGFYVYDLASRGLTRDALELGQAYLDYRDVTERFPAFNVRGIINKILEGYEIQDNLPDFFDDLYVMYTGEYNIRNDSEWEEDNLLTYTQTASVSVDDSNAGVGPDSFYVADYINYNIADTIYTVPETGTYRLRATIDGTVIKKTFSGIVQVADATTVTNGKILMRILKNGAVVVYQENVLNFTGSNYEFNELLNSRFLELTEGDLISVQYICEGDIEITSPPADPSWEVEVTINPTDSIFRITPLRWYGVGSTVDVSAIMPDMECLEFLKGILTYYNINVYYRPSTKTVIFWQDDFNIIADWTDKVLLNKGYSYSIPESQKFVIKFKEDTTDVWQKTNELRDYELGTGDERTIQLLFTDTYSFNIPNMGVGERQTFVQENGDLLTDVYEFKTKSLPRILQLDGSYSYSYELTFAEMGAENTATKTSRVTIPNFANLTGNVLLGDTTISGTTYKGIGDKYHRKTIESVNNGTVFSCTLLMTNQDILGLINCETGKDFRTAFHIHGANYRLLELEQLEGNIYKGRFLQIF